MDMGRGEGALGQLRLSGARVKVKDQATSLNQTTLIYKRAGNLQAIQLPLGHTKIVLGVGTARRDYSAE